MAIYHLTAKNGSRTSDSSARAKFDYVAREGDYANREDRLLYSVSGNMPDWARGDPSAYWKAADDFERANGRLYKELELAFPIELDQQQQRELMLRFVRELTTGIDGGNLPWTVGVHEGYGKNPHFHLMISERVNDGLPREPSIWFSRVATGKNKTPEQGGAKKIQLKKNWLLNGRKVWADFANEALAAAGHSARIDHRTLVDQRAEALAKGDLARAAALDRAPGEHIGPRAAGYEQRTGMKSNRRKHIERRQRERDNLAREVLAVDRTSARYEKQIRADQDALRRERGLRAKDAITRRIAADRAAGKIPAPVVRPVSPAPAAAGAAASQPKKPASLTPTPAGGGKPTFHSARIAVAVDHKANATIEQKIRKEEQAMLDFIESLNKKKQQESFEKFMREMRNALESHDEQQEQPKLAKRVEPLPDRVARANASRQAMQDRKSSAPAPAAADPAASQPQAKPATAAPTAPSPAPGGPDRPASVDSRAAAEDRRREAAERRIRLALSTGKGKSAALVDALRNADAESIERLIETGADATANRCAALEAAAQAKRDDLFGKLLRGVPLQDHSDLQQLAQRVGPEAAQKLRELSKAAKLGGSLQAAGIEQPKGPASGPSAGPKGPSGPSGPR